MNFYPAAKPGKVLAGKYELVCKLGYGECWTEWLGRNVDQCVIMDSSHSSLLYRARECEYGGLIDVLLKEVG